MRSIYIRRMKKLLIGLVVLLVSVAGVRAGTIRGRVTDPHTGEALVGVTVQIRELKKLTMTGLDGAYEFRNVAGGRYEVVASAVAYAVFTGAVVVGEGVVKLDIALVRQQKELEQVAVTAVGVRNSGASDAGARQLEKVSDNVENILSTHQILLMPDITVANVLRRVSGVTVDRGEDGEGRYPVIRGMDKRYNYTLVNGIKIPSPDDKNRYVPMDLFPSEMLQRLEVIKSLTPDMEGDAIGGVMNMVMKDPPAHLTINVQGAGGYSQMLLNQSFTTFDRGVVQSQAPNQLKGLGYTPVYSDFTTANLVFTQKHPLPDGQLGLTLGNRYFDNRLGVVVSGSVQSIDRITKDAFFSASPQPSPLPDNSTPLITDEEHRMYSTHEERMGAHAKLDYRFDNKNRISLYTVFIQLNSYQSRFFADTAADAPLGTGSGSKDVSYDYRSRSDFQSIYNATLQGQHAIGSHLSVDWSGVYSHAGQKMPDRAQLTLQQTFADSNGVLRPYNPPALLSGMERIWQHNSDQDVAGYLNLHYRFGVGEHAFDIGVGGMARHKDRSNYFIRYEFSPAGTVHYTGPQNAAMILTAATTQDPNTYTATEDIDAGYGEVRWKYGRWNVLAGVRFEHTQQTYDQTEVPVSQVAKSGTASYLDALPSVQVKYSLNALSALHLSYFSAVSRPGFFEIVPYDFPGEYFNEIGNPKLVRATSNNVDLRYELFPGLADQLLVGAFYKRIVNPIEYVYTRPATSESALEPANVGTATNIGAELVYTHYFHKFGVSLNYTYTHSNIPTSYSYYYAIPGKDTTVSIGKNRPLQGQADHIGNLSLLFKDPAHGWDLQLATIYTGKHIVYLSEYATPSASMDYWQRGTFIVDFSGEKTVGKHLSVYVKLNNLLNTADIVEMYFPPTATVRSTFPDAAGRSDRTLVEKKTFGQTYLAGIRYHF